MRKLAILALLLTLSSAIKLSYDDKWDTELDQDLDQEDEPVVSPEISTVPVSKKNVIEKVEAIARSSPSQAALVTMLTLLWLFGIGSATIFLKDEKTGKKGDYDQIPNNVEN